MKPYCPSVAVINDHLSPKKGVEVARSIVLADSAVRVTARPALHRGVPMRGVRSEVVMGRIADRTSWCCTYREFNHHLVAENDR
ncbi:hypothetical protein ACWCP6_33380 [Streptomyces sp. NPDC002004]